MFYDVEVRNTVKFASSCMCAVLIIIVISFLMQVAMTCMTLDGCLRPWCNIGDLNLDYQKIALLTKEGCINYGQYN